MIKSKTTHKPVDHDRLFKELISAFFSDFVSAFLPDVAVYLDPESDIVTLDKEMFSDITSGDEREADVVMRVKFRGQDAFFLVHVENQASPESGFAKRMFRYCIRLHERYDLPVYPVGLFSYDKPQRSEATTYEIAFPHKAVVRFEYTAIQLNRMRWQDFVDMPNPVACALMSKMQISPSDRPKVKVQCLRLLATLRLDPAKSSLIGGFLDSYLRLTALELKGYEREFEQLKPEERASTMALISDWEQKGIERGIERGIEHGIERGIERGIVQGIAEGERNLLRRQIARRFGAVSDSQNAALNNLGADDLGDLGEALLGFNSSADLDAWLSMRARGS